MRRIRVELQDRSYDVIIDYKLLDNLSDYLNVCDLPKKAIIITNPTVKRLYSEKILASLKKKSFDVEMMTVADTEKSKSFDAVVSLVNKIARIDKGRGVFIVALGGGVIGDLAGFLAAIYKRGVSYIQIPTTLLSQVDSSIGGKVGIDLRFGKNLVGSFYQPRLVLSDISVLNNLPKRQVVSGLGEVIKYAIIVDKNLFSYLEKNYKAILCQDKKSMEHIISVCSAIKAAVVSFDERETKGFRTILNYGHTIGHAIETVCGYSKRFSHGEAIAIGMLCAADISNRLGLINDSDAGKIRRLIGLIGLPTNARGLDSLGIFESLHHDKKFINGRIRMVLPTRIGHVVVLRDVPQDIVKASIKSYT